MKKKLKLDININNIFFIYIILIFVNNSNQAYVTIPFKIYWNEEPSKYSSIEDYFTYQSDLKYYGQISIGENKIQIPIFFSFDDFGFYFITKGTDLGNIDSSYDPSSSPSCNKDPFGNLYFKQYGKATRANDTFTFNENSENELKCKLIKFIYAMEDNKKKNSFLMIGLRLIGDIIRDGDLNIVEQLKQNKYTDTYDWSIHYDENNPESGGILLIGTEPHNYNPKKFNQSNYFNSVTMSKEIYGIWNIQFDKIYFLNKKDEIQMKYYMKFSFKHQSGLIAGTSEYENNLKKYFFDSLISSEKCHMEKSRLSSRVYICKNTQDIKKELKKKFPALKMLNKAYMKTFELTYDDLFKEKGDQIYFLVYFSSYQASTWEVGLPFLKKYFLNYNYDTKLISFYNDNIENIENNKNEGAKAKLSKVLIIFGLVFIISILGFFFGRTYVLLRRKQKLSAKELENEFNKQINDSEYKPPINEKDSSEYKLI